MKIALTLMHTGAKICDIFFFLNDQYQIKTLLIAGKQ